MKYFEYKQRNKEDSLDKFVCLKPEYQDNSTLHELIRDLHFDSFPNERLYELISDLVEGIEDYKTRDDFEASDIGYCIYLNEHRRFFQECDHIIECAWLDLEDYVGELPTKQVAPYYYQARIVDSFVTLCKYRVAEWAEKEGLFSGE